MIRKTSTLFLATAFTFACISADDPNKRTKQGAGAGAAAGAVVGAVIGNQSGNNRTGAVVGAAAGAAIGAAVGRRMDQQQKELQQIPGVEVTRPSEGEIAVQLTNDVLFDFNSSTLRNESRSALRDLAQNVARYPDEVVVVEGHTDNVGAPSYNQTLSERRANAVREYLVDQGITSGRISAYGYGETRPKASNDSPEGRQLNRRVEIRIRATAS
jgi:outer membrane protein OmpA-like peptidoglycan-associated protein